MSSGTKRSGFNGGDRKEPCGDSDALELLILLEELFGDSWSFSFFSFLILLRVWRGVYLCVPSRRFGLKG